MTAPLGRSVRLFLVDGSATGPITAEIINWTGHLLTGSRGGLPAFLRRPELDRTGVYLLTGHAPDDPDTLQVYIGESDNVRKRLQAHSKDESKSFWERTCVVTSKDQNITKAHARYLESRLIAITKGTDTVSVVNNTAPPLIALPEADKSDMEYFVDQLRLILPVLGLEFLHRQKSLERTLSVDNVDEPHFQLVSKKHDLQARALEIDGEFIVLQESDAAKEFSSNYKGGYSRLHARLIKSGKLAPGDNGHLCFTENVTFNSPSAASAVVLGRLDNGRTSWKVGDTNVTYGEWQTEQANKT